MIPSATVDPPRPEVTLSLSPRDIPLLPARMLEVLRIANDPSVSIVQIERCIGRDPAMAARVLTVANSSYYGCSRRIDSVRAATAMLGTRQIQNIAAALAVAPAFDSEQGPQLWAHAVACAMWSQCIVRQLGLASIEFLFTTALVHDIGLVMLLSRAPQLEFECIEAARLGADSLTQLERTRFGCDHAELGARVCRAWNLPERIERLIAVHHEPLEELETSTAILELADHLASSHGCPELAGMAIDAPRTAVFEALHVTPAMFTALEQHADAIAAEASGLT